MTTPTKNSIGLTYAETSSGSFTWDTLKDRLTHLPTYQHEDNQPWYRASIVFGKEKETLAVPVPVVGGVLGLVLGAIGIDLYRSFKKR